MLHFTCPDFVFLSHMSHTSFLVVLFLGCVDLIFLSGNLFSTAIVNGIPLGPKKYELNHPNLICTFALLIFIVRSLYVKPITFTKQTVFPFFFGILLFLKHLYFLEVMLRYLTLYCSMQGAFFLGVIVYFSFLFSLFSSTTQKD